MPILGIIASSILSDTSAYFPIATTTLTTATASVTFSSIPATYTHLQLRVTAQTNRATYGIDEMKATFNGDGASNYRAHIVYGDGASYSSGAEPQGVTVKWGTGFLGTTTGANWGSMIVDILDYTNTNTYTTQRVLGGVDCNGTVGGLGGRVGLTSGLWMNTAAVTSMTIIPANTTNFSQYSSFTLYGIKG